MTGLARAAPGEDDKRLLVQGEPARAVREPGTDDRDMIITRDDPVEDADQGGSPPRVVRSGPAPWGVVQFGVEQAGAGDDDDPRPVFAWDPAQTPHWFVVGGSGKGKTTLGGVLAQAWLGAGWSVVWVSPTAGADPVPGGCVVGSEPGDVARLLERVVQVVDDRVEALTAEGVSRFDELALVPVPVLVVVDGAFAYVGAQVASKGPSRRVRAALGKILSAGRPAGVSVVLFSHAVEDVLRVRSLAANLPGRGVFLDCDEDVWSRVFGKPKPRVSRLFPGSAGAGDPQAEGGEHGPGVLAVMMPRRGRRSGAVVRVVVDTTKGVVPGPVVAAAPAPVLGSQEAQDEAGGEETVPRR